MMMPTTFVSHARRIALASGLLTMLAMPAAAGPAGVYVRTIEGGAAAAERCAEAAARVATDGIADCSKAIGEAGTNQQAKAASLTNRALLYRSAGNVGAALEDCGQALALVPDHPGTAVTCSAVHINAGNPRAAIDMLEAAPLPEPGLRYRYYHNLALAHHDLGEYAQAYDYLLKTLEAKPGFAPAMALKAQYRVAGE